MPENAVEKLLTAVLPLCWKGHWLTMDEIVEETKMHPGSIRWAMKQLRTGEEGDFLIRRRRRTMGPNTVPEFYIKRKPAQLRFEYD